MSAHLAFKPTPASSLAATCSREISGNGLESDRAEEPARVVAAIPL